MSCRATPSRHCLWGASATTPQRRSCGGSLRSTGLSRASASSMRSALVRILLLYFDVHNGLGLGATRHDEVYLLVGQSPLHTEFAVMLHTLDL